MAYDFGAFGSFGQSLTSKLNSRSDDAINGPSQGAPKPTRRGSVGGADKRELDLPIVPVTVKIIAGCDLAANNPGELWFYGTRVGVTQLVGWISDAGAGRETGGEWGFKFSDGTHPPIDIELILASHLETQISPLVASLVQKDKLVVLSGQPYKDENGTLSFRAFHIRGADSEEFAYYHILDCAHSHTESLRRSEGVTSSLAKMSISDESPPPTAALPAELDVKIVDPVQRKVLQCILEFRTDERGESATKIKSVVGPGAAAAIASLEDSCVIFNTDDDYYDIL